MSPLKYGTTPWGTWERDAGNLPCLVFDPTALPPRAPPLVHLLGNGRLAVLCDQRGRLRFFRTATDGALQLRADDWSTDGCLFLNLICGGQHHPFSLCELRPAQQPRLTFGIGYVRMTANLAIDAGTTVAVAVDWVLPPAPDAAFLLVRVRLALTQGALVEGRLHIAADAATAFAAPGRLGLRHFCRNGVAMLTEVHDDIGDIVLAGGEPWTAGCQRTRLWLERPCRLAPGEDAAFPVLVGFRRDCSLRFLQEQLHTCDLAAAQSAWAELVLRNRPRTPDLWMQEELLWNTGLMLSNRLWHAPRQRLVAGAGGPWLAQAASLPGPAAEPVPCRETLLLALALTDRDPDLARTTLLAVAGSQARTGRLPERLHRTATARLDPATDRSDLELLLLLAIAELAPRVPDPDAFFLEPVPFADGSPASLWEHLRAAYRCLRDEVQTGPRGHLRMLAGDWNPHLNRVGTAGHGESVLNTAMAVYALERLGGCARQRHDTFLAEEMQAWLSELRKAVGNAFDGNWFCRAFTDAGRTVGGSADGRVFLDVQAWAVLAGCGTAQQRQAALQSVLTGNAGEAGLRLVSAAFPLPPPDDVSDLALAAGEDWNAGVSLPAAAWLLWALGVHGRKEAAMAEWEKLTLRRLGLQYPDVPPSERWALPLYASELAGGAAGSVGARRFRHGWPLPATHAALWQEFALRRIQGA